MPDPRIELAVADEPLGGPEVQRLHEEGLVQLELLRQHAPEQLVEAQRAPRVVHLHVELEPLVQPAQDHRGVGASQDRVAQAGVELVEDGGADQELLDVVVEPVEDLGPDVGVGVVVRARVSGTTSPPRVGERRRRSRAPRYNATAHPLRVLDRPGDLRVGQPAAHPGVQGGGLVHVEREGVGVDREETAGGARAGEPRGEAVLGEQHDRRAVRHPVGDGLEHQVAGGVGEQVDVVDDEEVGRPGGSRPAR